MEQLCLLLFLLSSTVHLAACLAGKRRWRAASKPLLLLTLLLWYCAAATRVQPFIAAGLALSLAGDVLLMIPGLFRAGGMAFFGAHLCYIAAFLGGRVAAQASLAARRACVCRGGGGGLARGSRRNAAQAVSAGGDVHVRSGIDEFFGSAAACE